jgi:hypothetical protein
VGWWGRTNPRRDAVPDYACQRHGIERALPICQTIPGGVLDEARGELLLATVTPLTLEVALAVEQELVARLDQADALRRQHCERLRYEADLARRRYLQVDPGNRLVADELERDWNNKLRAHRDAVAERDRKGRDGEAELSEAQQDLRFPVDQAKPICLCPQAETRFVAQPGGDIVQQNGPHAFLRHIRVDSKAELKERILRGIAEINAAPVVHRWNKFEVAA